MTAIDPPPHARVGWRKRVHRAVSALVGILVTAGAVVIWGWRYGWTPLPEAPPGRWIEAVTTSGPPAGEQAAAQPASPWRLWRSLARSPRAERWREEGEKLRETWIAGWARGEAVPPEAIRLATEWLEQTSQWQEAWEALAAAPAVWPQASVREEFGSWVRHVETRFLLQAMVHLPGVQATGEDSNPSNPVQAMEALLCWMELQSRLTPFSLWPRRFDERGWHELEDTGLAAWRWMVEARPPLPAPLRRRWHHRLERAAVELPDFEQVYTAMLKEHWARWEQDRFSGAPRGFRTQWNLAMLSLVNWWRGCRRIIAREGDQGIPALRSLWPEKPASAFGTLVTGWLQYHCARSQDARRLFTVAAAQVLRAGAEGGDPQKVWRHWIRRADSVRWYERPGAWLAVRWVPNPLAAWEEPSGWRVRLRQAASMIGPDAPQAPAAEPRRAAR